MNAGHWYEIAVLLLLHVIVVFVVFGGWFPGPVKTYPLAYLSLPFLLWAALKFDLRIVTSAILFMTALAVWGARQGYGPFAEDGERLQQILWNLLANAVKFTPQRGIIELHLRRRETLAEITIKDSGPGIPAEFLPRIFERFTQADGSSTRKHGGLGLGLAIVRHLIELHGGTVSASNRNENGGAVLTVLLPAVEPTAAELIARPVPHQ